MTPLSENGCTVPWVRNTSNICKQPKNINTTFWIAWNRITNQFNDCPVPCDSLLVSLGAKNFEIEESSEKASWTLFFAARTYLSEQDFLYTSLSLVAEIGKSLFINEVTLYKKLPYLMLYPFALSMPIFNKKKYIRHELWKDANFL